MINLFEWLMLSATQSVNRFMAANSTPLESSVYEKWPPAKNFQSYALQLNDIHENISFSKL